jgi:hypothetical protein
VHPLRGDWVGPVVVGLIPDFVLSRPPFGRRFDTIGGIDVPVTPTPITDQSSSAHHDDVGDSSAPPSRPVLLCYQTTRLATDLDDVARKRGALMRLAKSKGFVLGQIFDENDVNRPCAALVSLIAEARSSQVRVIAVPTVEDLGLLPHVQRVTRQRIEREAGVRVLVADLA